jgi:hypothetical protein
MRISDIGSAAIGLQVADAAGHSIGQLHHLFRDVEDSEVYFGAIPMLRRGRRRLVFVSLVDANVEPESITLRCGAELARRSPQTRPGRTLGVDVEADLYRHYGIAYRPRDDATTRLIAVT